MEGGCLVEVEGGPASSVVSPRSGGRSRIPRSYIVLHMDDPASRSPDIPLWIADPATARRLPGEHIEGGGLIQEFVPPEEPERAAPHHLLKLLEAPGPGLAWLVELDRAVGIFGEEAVPGR